MVVVAGKAMTNRQDSKHARNHSWRALGVLGVLAVRLLRNEGHRPEATTAHGCQATIVGSRTPGGSRHSLPAHATPTLDLRPPEQERPARHPGQLPAPARPRSHRPPEDPG